MKSKKQIQREEKRQKREMRNKRTEKNTNSRFNNASIEMYGKQFKELSGLEMDRLISKVLKNSPSKQGKHFNSKRQRLVK
jgi:hypothetical protein